MVKPSAWEADFPATSNKQRRCQDSASDQKFKAERNTPRASDASFPWCETGLEHSGKHAEMEEGHIADVAAPQQPVVSLVVVQ